MEAALTELLQTPQELILVAAGVFARIGAAALLVPGLGERSLSIRVKLGGALAIAVLLAPLIRELAPVAPRTPVDLFRVLLAEAAVGLTIGLAFRFLVYALQIAGMVAAQNLSVAQMFGTGVAPDPEPTIATLLSFGGIALAMIAGLHVHLVVALASLYDVFPFGEFPDPGSMGQWATEHMSRTFALGVTLAAPFVAIGFAYNIALGALNRAMPQLLVALVGVPFLVWFGMVVLFLVIPALFEAWRAHLDEVFLDPLGGLR